MFAWEWKELRASLTEMLKNGLLQWEFLLDKLDLATSVDIGMWVACNAVVENHSGKITFVVRKDSTIHKTLSITKLDQILSISFIK